MPTLLRYGADHEVAVDLPAGGVLVECGQARGSAIEDIEGAVAQALDAPLNYPALARGTTPGDRIALAVGAGVPQVRAIVRGVIRYLERCGVSLDGVTVLHPAGEGIPTQSWTSDWPALWCEQVRVVAHDPDDARQLSYLARDQAGEPVFLNRALTDADVVLPIGAVRNPERPGYFGIHETLFPAFSNPKAMEPFHTTDAYRSRGKFRQRLRREVEDVAWLLGVNFAIQVLPGGGDRVLRILTGEPLAVREEAERAHQAAWGGRVPDAADLVVAAIEGGSEQQTWTALGRALEAAIPLVAADGAIAVCCRLSSPPGPAVKLLYDVADPDEAYQRLRRHRFHDMMPAMALVGALQSGRVYLLSDLDSSLVEQLNLVPLEGADELLRLMRRSRSCTVLNNATEASVRVQADGG